jgi:hypothetical protein
MVIRIERVIEKLIRSFTGLFEEHPIRIHTARALLILEERLTLKKCTSATTFLIAA